MRQTRLMPAVEAITNMVAGYGLAVGLQLLLLPVFGLHPTLGQSLKIGIWITALSLVRGHALRRLFERLGHRRRAERRGSP